MKIVKDIQSAFNKIGLTVTNVLRVPRQRDAKGVSQIYCRSAATKESAKCLAYLSVRQMPAFLAELVDNGKEVLHETDGDRLSGIELMNRIGSPFQSHRNDNTNVTK